MQGSISDDSSRPHHFPGQLKLRLDERQNANCVTEKGQQRSKKRFQRDERGVYHGQIKGFGYLLAGQVTGIGALKDNHAPVLPQLPVKKTIADINAVHLFRTMLEQAVGKPAGGTSNIGADISMGIDPCSRKTGIEFITAATDETPDGFNDDGAGRVNKMPNFAADAVIDLDTAGADQSPCFLNVFRKSSLNEQKVDALFFYPRRQQPLLQFSQP